MKEYDKGLDHILSYLDFASLPNICLVDASKPLHRTLVMPCELF